MYQYNSEKYVEDSDLVEKMINLSNLTEKQEKTIRLHYWFGLSYSNISEVIGVSRNTIKYHHDKAIDKLRKTGEK